MTQCYHTYTHNNTWMTTKDDRKISTHTLTHPHPPKTKQQKSQIVIHFFPLVSSSFYYSSSFLILSSLPFLTDLTVVQINRENGERKKLDILMGKNGVYAKCEQMTCSSHSLSKLQYRHREKKYAGSMFNLMRTCFFVSSLPPCLLWMVCVQPQNCTIQTRVDFPLVVSRRNIFNLNEN